MAKFAFDVGQAEILWIRSVGAQLDVHAELWKILL